LAASTLVIMPPLPIELPAPPAMPSSVGRRRVTCDSSRACGILARIGGEQPDWSVRMISASASIRLATSEPRVSLSPNLISSVTTVSFSLMIGTTPSCSSVSSVANARSGSACGRPGLHG
jgi:hypothetical protein